MTGQLPDLPERGGFLYLFDLMGVAVFAVSGALASIRKGLDMYRVVVLAAITAIGGGTLRDLLLAWHPVFWMLDSASLVVILVAALLTVEYVRIRPAPGRTLLSADALGLTVFAISGAGIAEGAGHSPVVAILLGTITGVAGGMLRDALTAEVHLILQRDIYTIAAIAGISVYLALGWLGARQPLAAGMRMAAVVVLRLLVTHRGLDLAAIRPPADFAGETTVTAPRRS